MAKKTALPQVESRTVTLSVKIPERGAKAIERAAKDNGRTRSSLVWAVTEIWLKENGYLK
jgi:hypothetical protein